MKRTLAVLLVVCALPGFAKPKQAKSRRGSAERAKVVQTAPALDPAAINAPTTDAVGPKASGSAVVRAQILLDRFHYSPGEIDGQYGDNLRVALVGFQAAHNLPPSGVVDSATWDILNKDPNPPLTSYTITDDDVKGPFVKIPPKMLDQAKLDALGYQSPEEALGEKFHVDPDLLKDLNKGKDLTAGTQITVPNVQRDATAAVKADHVEVTKDKRTVTAFSADGQVLAQYPATIGSEHDPLPIGDWKVTVVQHNPVFHYNPDLFWDADPNDSKAKIAAGPNNPVGVVWIGLTKEHYGIHGTPEPGKIGHTESHGCIRLTNWDAEELSHMVSKGTPVVMKES